jgi:hypothetical protein
LSAQDTAGEAPGPGHGSDDPAEEELRAAYEAELSRITTTDMMAQAAVSLLNIGARRLAPSGGGEAPGTGGAQAQRDLEQARDAIDGVKGLLEILERRIPKELGPLRDALSRLQMAYTREIQSGEAAAGQAQGTGAPGGDSRPAEPAAGEQQAPEGGEPGARPAGPGPAESSGRLWVPGR